MAPSVFTPTTKKPAVSSMEATLIGLLSQLVQQQQQDRQVLQKLLLSELQPEEQEVELERKK